MVTKYPLVIALLLVAFFNSCMIKSPVKTVGKEFILEKPKFKLDYQLDKIGMQLIDTSAVYVYTETESSYALTFICLKFDAFGNFIREIKFHELALIREDFQVDPNSGYKGKFEVFDKTRIKLEYYTPVPNPFIRGWVRVIRKGEIIGDTIKINSDHNFINNYIRQEF